MEDGIARNNEVDVDEQDDLDQFIEEQDQGFREALDDAEVRSRCLRTLIAARHQGHASQAEVAELMGTTQSAVSELEGGTTDPRFSTLQRYARAVGCKLAVDVLQADAGLDENYGLISPMSSEKAVTTSILARPPAAN